MSDACQWLHEKLEPLPLIRYPFNPDLLPENGIYFFYEEGETWGHGALKPRIVRVGTHKDGNFQDRISQHFLLDESKMDFDQNHSKPSDRSIFRKHLGRALLNEKQDEYLKTWNIDFMTKINIEQFSHLRDIPKEKETETRITNILRKHFSFRFIIIDNQVERMGEKGLEKHLIGTLAHCQQCKKSDGWLGTHHPNNKVSESGLWLVQHLKAREISEDEKTLMFSAIRRTEKFLIS